MALSGTRKGGPQTRGLIRRQQLLDSARELLNQFDIDKITLSDVAANAGIPKTSAYHFYDDINAAYSELARQLAGELKLELEKPVPPQNHWEDLVALLYERGTVYLRGSRAATQLLLGPKTPLEIKHSDRSHDRELSRSIISLLCSPSSLYLSSQIARAYFSRSLEIVDLFLGLSVLEAGELQPTATAEAIRAALAYLNLYIPKMLIRVDEESNP